MKIRTGFVSNSSSSSYVCDLCGEEYTGWDASLNDAGMFECVNGHVICTDEAVTDFDEAIEAAREKTPVSEDEEFDEYEFRYEAPEELCPFCQMIEFTQGDLMGYLKKKTKIPESEVFAEVKAANKRRKKLYPSEYVMYGLNKLGIKTEDLITEIKANYKTFKDFRDAKF